MPILFVNPAGHRKSKSKKRKYRKITRSNPMAGKGKKSKKGKGKGKKSPARKKSAARKPASSKPKRRRVSTKVKLKAAKKLLSQHGMRAQIRTKVKAKQAAAKDKAKAARDAKKAKAAAAKKAKLKRAAIAAGKAAAKASARAMKLRESYMANPSRRRRRRKHNPSRRRHHGRAHRRYRRNPAGGDFLKAIMGAAKMAAPAVAAMLAGKAISTQVISRVPMLSKAKGFEKSIVDVALLAAVHFGAPKVAMLRKYQASIMVGLGVNLIVDTLSAALPADLKAKIGLSGEGIYDRALSDYVTTSDYLTTGAEPIDDDIALADYVTTGAIEAELGLSEELGISEELGAIDAHTVRGGVSQTAMLKAVPSQSFSEEIPARSFTKEVAHAGEGFDNPGALYAGIFRGGF